MATTEGNTSHGAASLYSGALMEHVTTPDHNEQIACPCCTHEGINPSCGDDLTLSLEMGADGTITDAAWQGTGCAVCQGSADMACDAMLGRTPAEAADVCRLFGEMVRGEVSDPASLEPLDEAASLVSVAHMPARVKCAELAWRTLEEMLAAGAVAPDTASRLR